MAFFVGKQDDLATPFDALWAKDQIGEDVIYYQEIDQFNHHSFTFGLHQKYDGMVDGIVSLANTYSS